MIQCSVVKITSDFIAEIERNYPSAVTHGLWQNHQGARFNSFSRHGFYCNFFITGRNKKKWIFLHVLFLLFFLLFIHTVVAFSLSYQIWKFYRSLIFIYKIYMKIQPKTLIQCFLILTLNILFKIPPMVINQNDV